VKGETTTKACDITTAQTKKANYDINRTLLEGIKLSLTARRSQHFGKVLVQFSPSARRRN
jgi:hypothetical protein